MRAVGLVASLAGLGFVVLLSIGSRWPGRSTVRCNDMALLGPTLDAFAATGLVADRWRRGHGRIDHAIERHARQLSWSTGTASCMAS